MTWTPQKCKRLSKRLLRRPC